MPASSAQPNIQDVFLNYARRDRLAVDDAPDGRPPVRRAHQELRSFAVIVEVDGTDQLMFKHAIATIETHARGRELFLVTSFLT